MQSLPSNTIKARFVDGPWHNAVREVRDCLCATVEVLEDRSVGHRKLAEIVRHRYYKQRLFTLETAAEFYEYWHESISKRGEPRVVATWGAAVPQLHGAVLPADIAALVTKLGAEQLVAAAELSPDLLHGDGSSQRLS